MGTRAWSLAVLVLVLAALLSTTVHDVRWATQEPAAEQPTDRPEVADDAGPGGGTAPDATAEQDGWWGSTAFSLRRLAVLGLVGGSAVLVLAALRHLRLRRVRPRGVPVGVRRPPPAADEEEAPAGVAPLAEAVEAELGALDSGTPRNAVVAAWVGLEQAAERVGFAPRPADTATEFARRALAAYPLDPRTVDELATLYLRARFSRHEPTEEHRERARQCLRRLRSELGGVP